LGSFLRWWLGCLEYDLYFRGEKVVRKELVEGVDAEWMALILEAKLLGLDQETIREFLNQNGVRQLINK
jgi:hypothetical protein